MKSKVFASLQIFLLATFLFGQTTTPSQSAPKSDDKPACSCCAGHDMSKCKDMAECKGKDCCKGDKCTDKCPMMGKSDDKGHAGMMCGDKGGTMSSDMKMDCCKDGKCTAKCPMNKTGKDMACADCCKDNKCPMMNKDDKDNKSSAEMKGCCGGNKCAAGHMHEGTGN